MGRCTTRRATSEIAPDGAGQEVSGVGRDHGPWVDEECQETVDRPGTPVKSKIEDVLIP